MKTWKAVFGTSAPANERKFIKAGDYTVLGYGVRVLSSKYVGTDYHVTFQILTGEPSNIQAGSLQGDSTQAAPLVALPIAAIAVGILAIGGLAALYFNLKTVNEIIDSPQGSALAFGFLIIAGFIAYKTLKGK